MANGVLLRMSIKDHRLFSILKMRCPQCHDGTLFVDPNPYKPGSIAEMRKSCPNCGESFTREPGFYFGAAYVSYGLSVALWVAVIVALLFFDLIGLIEFEGVFDEPMFFLSIGVVTLLLLLPLIYRLSRSIWIHMFVKSHTNN
jgi:ribosomal protein S27AE